jgi:hypothetical protein
VTTQPAPRLEIHLEELGRRSWVMGLMSTLTGSFGTAQYRFVARPPVEESGEEAIAVLGATFPVLRAQNLDDLVEPHAWLDLARARLEELEARLRAEGWSPESSIGRHWWSRTYVRPGDYRRR